jgi:hypothetical protein
MKVEQIFEKDLEQNFKSPVWREIDFANIMSSKYPQQFMKIFEYENKRCDYIHELEPNRWSTMNVKVKQYFEELFLSPFCSIKITSIIDIMLHDIIYKISDKNIIYNLFIQVVYLSFLINKEGYYHRDLHPKNIGVIYTNDEFINILGKNIQTNGYILQAIDYGMVIHAKYDLEENERKQLIDDNNLYQNVYKIIFKIILRKLIEKYPDKDINQLVPISKKDQKKIKKILNHIIEHPNYVYFEELLYKIIFKNYNNFILTYYIWSIKININNQIGGGNLIIHISGPQGAGKTTLGNKIKDKYGDHIYLKDLDDLYAEFSNQKKINDYQLFINNFIKKITINL